MNGLAGAVLKWVEILEVDEDGARSRFEGDLSPRAGYAVGPREHQSCI